jgi:hypothetical protein
VVLVISISFGLTVDWDICRVPQVTRVMVAMIIAILASYHHCGVGMVWRRCRAFVHAHVYDYWMGSGVYDGLARMWQARVENIGSIGSLQNRIRLLHASLRFVIPSRGVLEVITTRFLGIDAQRELLPLAGVTQEPGTAAVPFRAFRSAAISLLLTIRPQ